GDWPTRIQGTADDRAIDRRRVVEDDARAGRDGRIQFRRIGRLDRVTDETTLELIAAGLTRIIRGCQQAARRIAHDFAGVRIDRLQQPGGGTRLNIDTGGDAQDESLAAGEVEVTLEIGLVGRNVDVDIAQPQVVQA